MNGIQWWSFVVLALALIGIGASVWNVVSCRDGEGPATQQRWKRRRDTFLLFAWLILLISTAAFEWWRAPQPEGPEEEPGTSTEPKSAPPPETTTESPRVPAIPWHVFLTDLEPEPPKPRLRISVHPSRFIFSGDTIEVTLICDNCGDDWSDYVAYDDNDRHLDHHILGEAAGDTFRRYAPTVTRTTYFPIGAAFRRRVGTGRGTSSDNVSVRAEIRGLRIAYETGPSAARHNGTLEICSGTYTTGDRLVFAADDRGLTLEDRHFEWEVRNDSAPAYLGFLGVTEAKITGTREATLEIKHDLFDTYRSWILLRGSDGDSAAGTRYSDSLLISTRSCGQRERERIEERHGTATPQLTDARIRLDNDGKDITAELLASEIDEIDESSIEWHWRQSYGPFYRRSSDEFGKVSKASYRTDERTSVTADAVLSVSVEGRTVARADFQLVHIVEEPEDEQQGVAKPGEWIATENDISRMDLRNCFFSGESRNRPVRDLTSAPSGQRFWLNRDGYFRLNLAGGETPDTRSRLQREVIDHLKRRVSEWRQGS